MTHVPIVVKSTGSENWQQMRTNKDLNFLGLAFQIGLNLYTLNSVSEYQGHFLEIMLLPVAGKTALRGSLGWREFLVSGSFAN